MNFQVVQQFEDPVGVNCNFTHWSEGACSLKVKVKIDSFSFFGPDIAFGHSKSYFDIRIGTTYQI